MKQRVPFQDEHCTQYAGTGALRATEKYLENYNKDIVSKLSSPFHREDEILEFGAGIGTLAVLWELKTAKKPDCLEIDETQCETLRQRGLTAYSNLNDLTKSYHGIYTSNVLEHIEDDVGALNQLKKFLKDEGVLAIYVPAFQCLYSGSDKALGHYRRYGKKELLEKLTSANYEIISASYSDSLGFLASLILKLLEPFFGPASIEGGKSWELYDKWIYPVSRILDRLGAKYLFGKNLWVVAKKLG